MIYRVVDEGVSLDLLYFLVDDKRIVIITPLHML